jgi:Protein of Unknown function (DUF2784)
LLLEDGPPVPYRILADVVMVLHLAFIVFVAIGSLLVLKWRRLVWPHLAVVAWAAAIVSIGFTCPLTPVEKHLRERAGSSSYEGGFIDHYLDGLVYPGGMTTLARLMVAVLIAVGYAAVVVRNRHVLQHDQVKTARPVPERPGDR